MLERIRATLKSAPDRASLTAERQGGTRWFFFVAGRCCFSDCLRQWHPSSTAREPVAGVDGGIQRSDGNYVPSPWQWRRALFRARRFPAPFHARGARVVPRFENGISVSNIWMAAATEMFTLERARRTPLSACRRYYRLPWLHNDPGQMVSREALRNGMKGRGETERRVMRFWGPCEKMMPFSDVQKPFDGGRDLVMLAISDARLTR